VTQTQRSLAEAISLLERRYGPRALRRGSDPMPAAVWSTGLPVLDDQLLAGGGLPVGLVTVLAGESQGGAGGATGRLSLLQGLLAIASRQMQVAYVDLPGTLDPGYVADFGLDPTSCLVVRPPGGAVGPGLAMARALIRAGVPWVGVAFPNRLVSAPSTWEHPLSALVAAAKTAGAVLAFSALAPLPAPLAHASSLTIACSRLGWHEVHGDVDGIRIALTISKSKISAPGATGVALVRYPRPHAVADVVGMPTLLGSSPDRGYAVFADELGHPGVQSAAATKSLIVAG
jgi:hypothetical protein